MILDGTTITLPPTPALKEAFPPATNQHGESAWPVAMLMVAAELATGCVLAPEVDAMDGENNSSEAAQAERIIDRLPQDALVIADAGFGIFRVAYHCDRPPPSTKRTPTGSPSPPENNQVSTVTPPKEKNKTTRLTAK